MRGGLQHVVHEGYDCAFGLDSVMSLPRFSGHRGLGNIDGGVHDAEDKTSLCAGVPDGGRAAGQGQRQVHLSIFSYIEGFYNRKRRHSALGYPSPKGQSLR